MTNETSRVQKCRKCGRSIIQWSRFEDYLCGVHAFMFETWARGSFGSTPADFTPEFEVALDAWLEGL